jgi:H+/Cl- antiporter ClcA
MQTRLKISFYAVLAGVFSGLSAWAFLVSLQYCTEYRVAHPNLVFGLPFAGLMIGLIYHYFGKEIQPGTSLILDEIQTPKKITPFRMGPAIFVTTLLTHLFGGSAGREGTVVQMGASFADQLSRYFKISSGQRRILLVAGMGAGFGSALGAPWAGIYFGIEVVRQFPDTIFPIIECTLASFVAFGVTLFLHAPHTEFPHVVTHFSIEAILYVILASILFAAIARSFLVTEHHIESYFKKRIKHPVLKPFIGGILLLLFFKLGHLENFEGLGLDTIQISFHEPLPATIFLLKLLLTAFTLGSGFKGGEFIPLIFMGATAGSFLTGMTHLPQSFLPALGCVGVFAAASKTPITSSIMAIELFGWEIAPYAIVTCALSSALSGRNTIYKK